MLYISCLFPLQYDEPDYEGFPTKMISAPDFEKDVLPHDPIQCMECAIPLIKAHRVGASLSIESINDSLARSRSHTSDSISSSTSSTPTTKVESQSGSDSRTGTEPSSVSRSLKSPADAPKFSVGSVKAGEVVQNGSVDSTVAEKETKSQDHSINSEGTCTIIVPISLIFNRTYMCICTCIMVGIHN